MSNYSFILGSVINRVYLIGKILQEPQLISSNKAETEVKLYKFSLVLKRPHMNRKAVGQTDEFVIQTYDFNIKRYLQFLKKDFLLSVEGRLINNGRSTEVFADYFVFLGTNLTKNN